MQPLAKDIRSLELDEELAKLIVVSVQEAFVAFFGMIPAAGTARFELGTIVQGDISGILTMSQGARGGSRPQVVGAGVGVCPPTLASEEAVFIVAFEEGTILKIMSRFYGRKFADLADPRIEQGVG